MLYLLPKLHKPVIPGRPIVSSCGSPTENISCFLDYYLQPLTRALPSYIRDTTDFLQKIRELPALPPESLLVTLDVSSLYTNIPHDEWVNACEEFLNTRTDQSPPIKDLYQLRQLILESNTFIFNGAYYLQLQGIAMGTRMVPLYVRQLDYGKVRTTVPMDPKQATSGVVEVHRRCVHRLDTPCPMLERVPAGIEHLPHHD